MTLVILGCLFLLGLVADVVGRFTPLPRVTLLIIAGIAVGPSGTNLVTAQLVTDWYPTLTYCALSMVGFLMGHQLSVGALKRSGKEVIAIALGKVLGAAAVVFGVLSAAGVPLPAALVIAGLATATDPVATFDVVGEIKSRGSFADKLLSVVAIDDALGLVMFSILLAMAAAASGNGTDGLVVHAVYEIGGSLLLGLILGVPMAYLTGRLSFDERKGEPIQAEAIGFVLLCAGLAILLDLSVILSSIVMGSVVTSLAKHHVRPFDAIRGIEWPFMILFFVLAGASLNVDGLSAVLVLTALYVVARALGTQLGIMATGAMLPLDTDTRRWMGLALQPQAGVALGMALVAAQKLPEFGELVLTIALASTVFLELVSPFVTRIVLQRVEHS